MRLCFPPRSGLHKPLSCEKLPSNPQFLSVCRGYVPCLPTNILNAKADLICDGPQKTILSLEALTGALEDDVKLSLRKVSHR